MAPADCDAAEMLGAFDAGISDLLDRSAPGRPPDSAPVNRPGLVQPADYRQVLSSCVGITLVAAGAIVRFAVPVTFIHGLNVHVVSVIVMLAGVFGLLLSLMVWGPLSRRRNHSGVTAAGAAARPAAERLPGPATSTRLVAAVIESTHCGGRAPRAGGPHAMLPTAAGPRHP
jgi:hypothetical protein